MDKVEMDGMRLVGIGGMVVPDTMVGIYAMVRMC